MLIAIIAGLLMGVCSDGDREPVYIEGDAYAVVR